MKKLFIIPFLILTVAFCSKPKQKLTILTGAASGNYYKAAQELNEVVKKANFELEIQESPGSNENITNLGSGKAQLALAQYDVILLNALYMGDDRKALVNKCYVIAPMSHEFIHIIVNNASNIKTLEDLKDKKVSIGALNSGTWISAMLIAKGFGNFDITESSNTVNLSKDESIQKLLAGELDAIFLTSMTGIPALKEIGEENSDKISLLSLGENFQVPDGFKGTYALDKIAAGTYPWQKEDAYSLVTFSYLLAFADYDNKQIESLSKVIYTNAKSLKGKSSLWEALSEEYSKKEMNSGVPYHQGTINYLKKN
jgi:TRAP transporter TAXI family solute receptor